VRQRRGGQDGLVRIPLLALRAVGGAGLLSSAVSVCKLETSGTGSCPECGGALYWSHSRKSVGCGDARCGYRKPV
jgi:hypothetical protein